MTEQADRFIQQAAYAINEGLDVGIKETEALARIRINKMLEETGWRFEDSSEGKANISLESGVKFDELGDDLELAVSSDGRRGAIDFLLLDKDKRPLVVLEAKRAGIDPLSAKEQARKYAAAKGARFIILSNGNIHYLWDTEFGNPETITKFPSQESLTQSSKYKPDPNELVLTKVDENYIIESQMPNFKDQPEFIDSSKRASFLKRNNLKQLRPYQVEALRAIQASVLNGNQRFLFEMATGTGKTLVSSAVIKLFLKSGNARRVLFLVDRLELETQAQKAFVENLGKDFLSVIYKNKKDDWAKASVVVSTVQTFMAGDRYKKEFSPTDFELVISDEAHRSIGGNSRAVFEYFVGYKLGLTATPKNYLRGFDSEAEGSQREYERRLLVDTYKTFGCEPGQPTFSYDLVAGANDGYLIKPTLVDARTEVTTKLLSDEGYSIRIEAEGTVEQSFTHKEFEKKVFNDQTNVAMCQALIDNGLKDPVAANLGIDLFGKTIVFAVTQKHAARLTNILNQIALEKWPETYGQSDFAMQVSSDVMGAQQMTINFANNSLGGKVKKPESYDSSKTRVVVTVGMMTTGYDCQDVLNIALMRPVFSPADFVQIKGRGTRKWDFDYNNYDDLNLSIAKDKFKFFDFFATCEYFENEFDYDEQIKLPVSRISGSSGAPTGGGGEPKIPKLGAVDLAVADQLATLTQTETGVIMKIDLEAFKKTVDEKIIGDPILSRLWHNGDVQGAEDYLEEHVFGEGENRFNLGAIRKVFKLDRNLTTKEVLEYSFGEIEKFHSKDEILESEWEKFMEIYGVDLPHYKPVKNFFKAYIVDDEVRDIIKTKQLARFHSCASFDFEDYEQLNGYKIVVPQYVNDYVPYLVGL